MYFLLARRFSVLLLFPTVDWSGFTYWAFACIVKVSTKQALCWAYGDQGAGDS
jgi:hypothetical protein